MKIHLLRDGEAFGPFSAEALREMVKMGVVFGSDLARYENAREWQPLSHINDLDEPLIGNGAPRPSIQRPPQPAPRLAPVEQPSSGPAVVAGLIVAVVGGWSWTTVAMSADREFGVIGLLTAAAAAGTIIYASLGHRGRRLQWIASVSTLAGILGGKLGVAWQITRLSRPVGGSESPGLPIPTLPELLTETVTHHFPQTIGPTDLLWIGLALVTAWNLPAARPPGQSVGTR